MDKNNSTAEDIALRQPANGQPDFLSGHWTAPITVSGTLKTPGSTASTTLYILLRHWKAALLFAITFSAGLLLLVRHIRDTYSPVAYVEVNAPEPLALGAHDTPFAPETRPDYMETQIEVLKSSKLAILVIRDLKLDENPEFVSGNRGHEGIWGLLSSTTKRRAPNRTEDALRVFKEHLNLSQVRNSKLIAVSFSSHDPVLAADVTNRLVHHYIELNFENGYETTMAAAKWLSQQLEELHKQMQAADEALVDYQRRNGIPVEFSSKDDESPTAAQLTEINHQLTNAEVERIQGQAGLMTIQPGHEDAVPQVRDSDLGKELRKRLADARAQLAENQTLFGSNHPSVKKLTNEIQDLKSELATERRGVVEQLQTAFNAAQVRERLLTELLERSKNESANLNEKMIRYRALKSHAQADETLYNTLYAQVQEAGITAGLRSTNLRLVDQARVLDTPTRPNRKQLMLIGILVSMIGGGSFAFILDQRRNAIHSVAAVRELTPVPVSVIPMGMPGVRASKQICTPFTAPITGVSASFLDRPRSPELEGVLNLHTAVTCVIGTNKRKVIVVTSPGAGDGKTTIAFNLAGAIAQQSRVCLMEADIRKPSLTSHVGMQGKKGLRDILVGSARLDDVLHRVPSNGTLTVLPVGSAVDDEALLLEWSRMRQIIAELETRFDYVIIDGPPLLPFADAKVLARLAHGVLLVVRCGITSRDAIVESFQLLEQLHATPMGIVLNAVGKDSPSYRPYKYQYAESS